MQSIHEGHGMKRLRTRERRQAFDSGQSFPFINSNGRVIHQDRRRVADRRLNSISLDVIIGPSGFADVRNH